MLPPINTKQCKPTRPKGNELIQPVDIALTIGYNDSTNSFGISPHR